MSTNYWRNRWINALVHNGIKRVAAEEAFSETYRDNSADYSKSPEIQAFMILSSSGDKLQKQISKSGSSH